MKLSRLIWGTLVIILGIFILGANIGWWDIGILLSILKFWPIILILIGLRLIVKNDIAYSIIFLIFILSIGSAAYLESKDRFEIFSSIHQSQKTQEFEAERGQLTTAKYTVEMGAVTMEIKGTDNENVLYKGSFKNASAIDIQKDINDKSAEIKFSEQMPDNPFSFRSNRSFSLDIAKNISTELELNTGASTLDLDLSNTSLGKLTINSGATSGRILLPQPAGIITTKISTGASSYDLLVPKEVELKISSNSALSSRNFDQELNLAKDGSVWKTQGFDSATNKIEITLETGASSIDIKTY